MNTTTADNHHRVDPEDSHERARLHDLTRNGTGNAAADTVPMFGERLRKTQRLLAFFAAMLITLFLAWSLLARSSGFHSGQLKWLHARTRQPTHGLPPLAAAT